MVFEAGEPVIWSKPADMPFDVKKPLPKIGGLFQVRSFVGMCDGSVKELKRYLDEARIEKAHRYCCPLMVVSSTSPNSNPDRLLRK